MPPPSFIATVVLAAVVLVLAIARIRSQRKLSNTAKTYQQSQRRLNRTLDNLSDAVRNPAGKCPHCGHSAQLASFAIASDPHP